MIISTGSKQKTAIIELHNSYYFANPRHAQTEFFIDGFFWKFSYEEKTVTVILITDIDDKDVVHLILDVSDHFLRKSITAEVSNDNKMFAFDWDSRSHAVQIAIDQNFIENQLSGYDFSTPDDLSDAILRIDDDVFHVHTTVLSLSSPYFKALFYGNFKESQNLSEPIVLKEIDSKAFKNFLNCIYCYPHNFKVTRENVSNLLEFAQFYDCKNVLAICEQFIDKNS